MKKNNPNQWSRTTMLLPNKAGGRASGFIRTVLLVIAVALLATGCKKTLIEEPSAEKLKIPAKSDFTPMIAVSALNPFKVLSFNVRHNDAGDPQTITQRQTLIKKVIVNNAPDIFGLQEFSDNAFESWFANEMTLLGYGYYWDEAASGAGNPRVIFFKNSRFTMEGNGTWAIGGGNTATYVKLLDNVTSIRYFVSNSHWQYNSQTVRIENAQKLADGIALYNTGGYPKIVFGDFNAQPNTTEVNNLKSALDLVDALGDTESGKTFHGWGDTGTTKLDWMMSDRSMAYLSSSIYDQKVDGYWPSDHWAVMATYVPAVFGGPHVDANGKSASSLTNFYFADVNGDGKDDKIYWNRTYDSGKPQVFLSNGNGTFTSPAVVHSQSASVDATTRYYFAYVNNDNKADLITWDPTKNSGHTRVYLATTNGNFSTTVIDNAEGTSAGTTTLYNFADVNNDGMDDKIYWNSTFDSGKIRVYLATGGGYFSSTVSTSTGGACTKAGTTFWYADLNNDGNADEIFWHPTENGGQTMAFLSNGNGTFTSAPSFNSGATSGLPDTKFYFADIDGDGRADKIYWSYENYLGKLKVYYSQTNNTFQGPVYSLRGTSQSIDTKFYFSDISGAAGGVRKADQIRWNYGESSGELRNYFAN